ncbi:MAG: branched-chain amino acid ABC transporter permease [Streptosporangiales bacterium]|nr:branched-chain amino acid ABC transporter permease [Streptosporangiales bacterium]
MRSKVDNWLRARFANVAWSLSLAGIVLMFAGALMPWTYDDDILGDLTVYLWPIGPQVYTIVLAVVGLLFLAAVRGPLADGLRPLLPGAESGVRTVGFFALLVVALVLAAIAVQLGGLINVDPGGWVVFAGSLLVFLASRALADPPAREPDWQLPDWAQIVLIAITMGLGLGFASYGVTREDAWIFVDFLVFVTGLFVVLRNAGVIAYLGEVVTRFRRVTMLAAFAVAFLFPFAVPLLSGGTGDAYMSIATLVLIFATTAIGLNMVVGLAGILDLGYIAFLGSGAYVGAILSQSAFATIDWHPPFIVVVLIGAVVAAGFGLVIGSPALRVSGDYLAIVTLAFGEIFRITMNNLDGSNGPDLTNGPNGIPGIPDLAIGGFDFGDSHNVLGIEIGRFGNYYLLLMVVTVAVIVAFMRLNDSRIGRGWVAIREDERAAEAMGINTFGLKLLAFSGGAFLAGLAGTIKAHYDVSVTPDQYQFLESAFVLSAVVLGGMGTVVGVLLGATIVKLLPEKLRFFSDYRLLLFGLLLIVMMRFRPEGIIASKRRQLELHEEDEQLAVKLEGEVADTEVKPK